MAKCMQCQEQEAVFSDDQGDHHICQDCSDLNMTARGFGAAKHGLAVLKMDDTKPAGQVPFYVPPPEEIGLEPAHQEAVDEIASRVGVDHAQAQKLWNAMEVVYCLLSEDGIVDAAGGCESERVIPDALEYIRRTANQPPTI